MRFSTVKLAADPVRVAFVLCGNVAAHTAFEARAIGIDLNQRKTTQLAVTGLTHLA